jgi:hypothetical protein
MKKTGFMILLVFGGAALLLTACGKSEKKALPEEQKINLDTTVGQLVRFAPAVSIPVQGYGLVAGLWGTGSSECPPALRRQLEKYVWQRMPNAKPGEVSKFIDSLDTAVVEITGTIPPLATTGERFDVQVKPLPQTQTTSLRGGILYTVQLKEMSRMAGFNQYTKAVGSAEGQLFTASEPTTHSSRYYIFGGGTSLLNATIPMVLNQPNYYAASAIRNRINERFGPNTANAVSRDEIQVTIPTQYHNQKLRFLSMIQQMYLSEDETLKKQRIEMLSSQLADPQKAAPAEIALEAIGKLALPQLAAQLRHSDATVRFYAARCMLNIGDNRGIPVLRDIACNPLSEFRIPAIESLSKAKLKDAEPALSPLLHDEKLDIRLAAYEQLVNLNSLRIKRIPIGGDFFLDLVNCPGDKTIYAYRKDNAQIVLFGSPITCEKSLFLDNGQIMINARPDDKYVSLVRRHPSQPQLIGPLKCGFNVEDIIRTLGHAPETDPKKYPWPGLGISYSEILSILEKMCRENMIHAKYIEGPLTDAGNFTPTADSAEEKTKQTPEKVEKFPAKTDNKEQ